ncbi:MAG: nickel pincer cofactor biosynthesis protein LarC [Elusimicrobiota bacterium]
MKLAYFDCSSGISGDMILSALVDAGLSSEYLVSQLKKLHIGNFTLKFSDTLRQGIHAKFACVHGGQHFKKFSQVREIIEKSKLFKKIKQQSLKIFLKLAKAEAKVHSEKGDVDVDSIHFHQLAQVDTMLDIAGAVIGLDALDIEKIFSSPLNLGIPAPATAEIIKGLPVYSTDTEYELTTPTGAAIISTIAADFCPLPLMRVHKTGAGAGTLELDYPNILKIYIGESEKKYFSTDEKILLETNIDDMDPRIYPYLQAKLLQNGAVDVWMTNIYSKKGRPGIILSVLTEKKDEKKIVDIIFSETTTLGIRQVPVSRFILNRTKTEKYKIAKLQNSVKKSAEFEEAVKIAERKKIPLREVL